MCLAPRCTSFAHLHSVPQKALHSLNRATSRDWPGLAIWPPCERFCPDGCQPDLASAPLAGWLGSAPCLGPPPKAQVSAPLAFALPQKHNVPCSLSPGCLDRR